MHKQTDQSAIDAKKDVTDKGIVGEQAQQANSGGGQAQLGDTSTLGGTEQQSS